MTASTYPIVGMKHRGAEEFLRSLPHREPVVLRRAPDNPHDPNAVEVWARGRHVGFLKAADAFKVARMIDQGQIGAPLAMDGACNVEGVGVRGSLVGRSWPCVEITT